MLKYDTLTTAAFMWEGVTSDDQMWKKAYESINHSIGAVEFASEVTKFAKLAEELCALCVDKYGYEFPGVFDYEVSAPFGNWYRDYVILHGMLPCDTEAALHLNCEVHAFFTEKNRLFEELKNHSRRFASGGQA